MSTFPFFLTRKKEIAGLVRQSRTLFDAASQQRFAEQVGLVFDSLIESRLSRAERTDELLRLVIHFELCGLICTLPSSDTYFVEHYKSVLDELIDACRWKQFLKGKPFDEVAERSDHRQADVRRWLTRLRERQKPGHVKRLALMLAEKDQQAVAYRTLRAFLAFLSFQHNIESKALFWLRDGRVQLRVSLVREYLFEQIAFRVYMFHTTSEASFIEESLSKVKHWVTARVAERTKEIGTELDEGINDIVSQVKIDFITKCQRKKADPESFYLDASLTSLLIGFVKQSKAIGKLMAAQKQDGDDTELADEETSTDEGFSSNDDWSDETTYSLDASDYLEEKRNIVSACLNLLEEKCRDVIMRHYNNSFSRTVPFQTLAIEFGESAKSLESRYSLCMEKLTKMARDAYNRYN